MTDSRIIFAGTPDFALASLEALVESGREPVAVLTQPDRPAGRGKKLTASPVKRYAEARGIPVLQPHTLRSDAAARVLPKSKFGEALGYIRNQWKPLQTYLSDGRVPLDNNEVEQLMKQVALGRKNWLFIGSVPAGQRAADFITLVSSAWRNDLDVWAYIKDVLDRLLAGETDYAALRPDSWRQTHPEAICEYRVTERRDRADRKQYRRAARRRNTPKSIH